MNIRVFEYVETIELAQIWEYGKEVSGYVKESFLNFHHHYFFKK
jgi:hypothetical protein